jgi:hypothetical protein
MRSIDWSEGNRHNDWRAFVPREVRNLWDTFTDEQRDALKRWAEVCLDRAINGP